MNRSNHDRELFYRKLLQERHDNPDMPLERFCRKHGISLWAFYHWRKRLGHAISERSAPSFLPVTMPLSSTSHQFIEVRLPGGTTIRFPGGFEKEVFRAIVETFSASEAA